MPSAFGVIWALLERRSGGVASESNCNYLHPRERRSMTATLPDPQKGSLPSQRFGTRHIGPQTDDREKMLAALGLNSLEQLVDQALPRSIRSTEPLVLPPALTESQTLAVLREL